MFEVIACVDDDGQVLRGEDLGETVGQFCAADPACEGDDSRTVDGGRLTVGYVRLGRGYKRLQFP